MTSLTYVKSLSSRFERAAAIMRYGSVVLLTGLISWLDLITPDYIFVTGFYFLPIFIAAWYCGTGITALVVANAIAIGLYSASQNLPSNALYWESGLAYSSVLMVFILFGLQMYFLRSMFNHLHAESRTDPLTGLLTRRGFSEATEFETARAARHGIGFTIAMIDLDNFKLVNDTQGHAAGDALLVSVSRCMTAMLRGFDLIARLGGDEFVILLPDTNVEDAKIILDRMMASLRPLIQSFDKRASASIGGVTVSADTEFTVPELMAKADAVMYSVKNETKDRVVVEKIS